MFFFQPDCRPDRRADPNMPILSGVKPDPPTLPARDRSRQAVFRKTSGTIYNIQYLLNIFFSLYTHFSGTRLDLIFPVSRKFRPIFGGRFSRKPGLRKTRPVIRFSIKLTSGIVGIREPDGHTRDFGLEQCTAHHFA